MEFLPAKVNNSSHVFLKQAGQGMFLFRIIHFHVFDSEKSNLPGEFTSKVWHTNEKCEEIHYSSNRSFVQIPSLRKFSKGLQGLRTLNSQNSFQFAGLCCRITFHSYILAGPLVSLFIAESGR